MTYKVPPNGVKKVWHSLFGESGGKWRAAKKIETQITKFFQLTKKLPRHLKQPTKIGGNVKLLPGSRIFPA
jgi:hypothetical protein